MFTHPEIQHITKNHIKYFSSTTLTRIVGIVMLQPTVIWYRPEEMKPVDLPDPIPTCRSLGDIALDLLIYAEQMGVTTTYLYYCVKKLVRDIQIPTKFINFRPYDVTEDEPCDFNTYVYVDMDGAIQHEGHCAGHIIKQITDNQLGLNQNELDHHLSFTPTLHPMDDGETVRNKLGWTTNTIVKYFTRQIERGISKKYTPEDLYQFIRSRVTVDMYSNIYWYGEDIRHVKGLDGLYAAMYCEWFDKLHEVKGVKIHGHTIYNHNKAKGLIIKGFAHHPNKVFKDLMVEMAERTRALYNVQYVYPTSMIDEVILPPDPNIRQLLTGLDLVNEGINMKHCIGGETYLDSIKNGSQIHFHINVPDHPHGYTVSLIRVKSEQSYFDYLKRNNHDSAWRIGQVFGYENSVDADTKRAELIAANYIGKYFTHEILLKLPANLKSRKSQEEPIEIYGRGMTLNILPIDDPGVNIDDIYRIQGDPDEVRRRLESLPHTFDVDRPTQLSSSMMRAFLNDPHPPFFERPAPRHVSESTDESMRYVVPLRAPIFTRSAKYPEELFPQLSMFDEYEELAMLMDNHSSEVQQERSFAPLALAMYRTIFK